MKCSFVCPVKNSGAVCLVVVGVEIVSGETFIDCICCGNLYIFGLCVMLNRLLPLSV